MERDVLGGIRRYLLARRGLGVEIAYRLAGESCLAEGSRKPAREIVMITSPAARSECGPVEQASLFGESVRKRGLDLSGFDLAALDALVSKCERCGLSGGRTRTVFGSGNRLLEDRLHRRGAGPRRGSPGAPLRRTGRAASHEDARRDRIRPGRGVHRQYPEMPAAGEPGAAGGRDGGVRAVPRRGSSRSSGPP